MPGGMREILRLGAATTLIVLASSMAGPVLAVLLQQRGHDTVTVGAFAMIPFLMVALLIPLMPRLLARWGMARSYRWGSVLQLAGITAYALGERLWVWSLGAAVAGVGAAALWNTTEALLAQEAPPEFRGRVMGLYQTALGAALALGPFVPALLQWSPGAILWLGVGLVAGCVALAFTAPHEAARQPAHARSGTREALRAVPHLALLAFTGGVFEAGLGAVGAAHASAAGMRLEAAATVAGAIGVGSFLFQYPAGAAADRFSLRRVFSVAAVLLLAASLLATQAGRVPALLWASGLVWGGVGGALYTLSMVQVAHVFQGRPAAGATAAMITGYTVGGTLGPLASGAALQWAGAPGLGLGLSGLAIAALAAAQGVRRA